MEEVVKFLRNNEIDLAIKDLMKKYSEFHWAVAWGSLTNTAKDFLKNEAKFRDVTFGIAFSQTDPDLIDMLIGVKAAKVVQKFPGGTFHPKIYGFRSANEAAAIVGSANFTFGGLGSNCEAAVLITGSSDAPFFRDLFKFTAASAKQGVTVSPEFAAAYRVSHQRAARMPKPAHNPVEDALKINAAALSAPLVTMDWAEYVHEVRAAKHHDVDDSLQLLRIAQKWFASVPSFADLSTGRRQAIAGTVVNKTERALPDEGQDWGWFGSMKGMGDYANLINNNDPHLARAIDSVPHKGIVTKQHFKAFVKHFEKAFQNSERMGGYATASRLLAMKRPDVFVCICKPNIVQASERMCFSRTTLALEDYWDKVVEVIRLSDWYNVEKPDSAEGELWESRAAMLDAIFYRP